MKKYKLYNYKGQDPIIRETLALITSSYAVVARKTGVCAGTLSRWRHKKTGTARFDTLQRVGKAHGMTLKWTRANR